MKLTMLAMVCITALTACSSAPAPPALETFAASELDELQDLDAVIETRVKAGRYPGAVFLVANADQVLHEGAVGEANVESHTAMRSDSIFRMMSMTKPVTAVAVMILVDDKKVALDDPVSRYVPQFVGFGAEHPQEPTPITIRHLLTHTAGLGFGSMFFIEDNLKARIDEIVRDGPGDPPGKKWQYSGFDGFDILARVVEEASGESYDRFLQRRLFEPLGMKDTGYVLDASQQARLVGLYKPASGTFKAATSFLADVKYPAGGAGLYSTGADYIKFAQMLAGRGAYGSVRILSTAAVDEISKEQLAAGFPGLPAGLGWGLGMRRVADPAALKSPLPAGAFGWSGAYGTHFWVDPAHHLTAVFMINLTTAGGAASPDALDYEQIVMRACKTDEHCGFSPAISKTNH
jgi:CubicO group peptidase (beta-lactamase class C family)